MPTHFDTASATRKGEFSRSSDPSSVVRESEFAGSRRKKKKKKRIKGADPKDAKESVKRIFK